MGTEAFNYGSSSAIATINEQQQVALDYTGKAEEFLNACAQLLDATYNVPLPKELKFEQKTLASILSDAEKRRPTRPSYPAAPTVSSSPPTAPTIDSPTIESVVVPPFTLGAPVVNIPSAPSPAIPAPPTAPSVSDPVLPTAPTLAFPDAPVVEGIQLPSPPSIQLPTFSSSLPVDDLVVPSNTFAFAETAYQSLLNDALKAKLLDSLENGGYGIEPADEQALWERARSRELSALSSEMETLTRDFAARGFPLRNGELDAAVGRVVQGAYDRIGEANRTIALERSKLYVENRQFTIKEVREIETVSMQYHNSMMERALNAAKATFEAGISIYNALIARYNARIAGYQASAQVYEAEIRGLLARVEIYKTEVEAAGLDLEARKQKIEIYKAQLAGIESIVGIYRAQMEAAGVQAQVERTRIEAYRSLVEAYGSQVQAKVAEFQGYEARVRGEVAKVEVYRARVEGFKAEADAAKTRADVNIANAQAVLEAGKARVSLYEAQVDQYKAGLEANRSAILGLTEIYKADVAAYGSLTDLARKAQEVSVNETEAIIRNQIAIQDANLRLATLRFEELRAAAQTRLSASQFGSAYYANVAAAALGAINASVSLGASATVAYSGKA